jgi:hypothetical protein
MKKKTQAKTKTKAKTTATPQPAQPAQRGKSLYDELKNAPAGSGTGVKAPFWKPEKIGAFVEGEILEIFDGQFDQQVVRLRQDGGETVLVPARRGGVLHRLLFQELEVRSPGRMVVIFDGEKTSAAGRKYRSWRAKFRPAAEQPASEWQKVQPDDDDVAF